jgi:hypothetical protein
MKCQAAQQQLVDALKEGPSIELENHLRECADCRAMLADFTTAAATLHEMPEIEPSAHVLNSLKRQMTLSDAKGSRIRRVFRLSWAAVLVVGILATIMIFTSAPAVRMVAYVSQTTPGSDYKPGQGLPAGRACEFPTYATLTIPDVGVIRVRDGSRLQFASANELVLEKGEVFIEITHHPQNGFHVRTEKFTATDIGTEFGATPNDVYVLSGSVQVRAGANTVNVAGGQLLHVNGSIQTTTADALALIGWVREYEPPAVRLVVSANPKLTLVKSEQVLLKLTNSSRYWPAFLRDPQQGGGYLRVKLTTKTGDTFNIALDQFQIVKANHDGKLIRVDENAPVEIKVTLTPELLAGAGKAGIFYASFVYTSGGDQDSRIWSGTVESRDKIEIEIRK